MNSRINANSQQNNSPLFPFSLRDYNININQDISQDTVIEEPTGDKEDLAVKELGLSAGSGGAFGTPGNVVNVAHAVDDHGLGVGALEGHVADGVPEEFEDEFGMGEDVDNDDEEGRADIDDHHDDGRGLPERLEPQISQIQIHANNIIHHQPKHRKRKYWQYARHNMRMTLPLFTNQRATYRRHYNKAVKPWYNNR